MKISEKILPMQVQSGIDASADFQHSLHELETYVLNSQNSNLADSFRKFKEALSEPDASLPNVVIAPSVQLPSAADSKPQTEERSYLAMSSLFSANVKYW